MRIFILFIGIAVLFFALTAMGSVSKNPTLQTTCVNTPDPKHVAIYNGGVYRRIRADTPIFYKEVPVHFAPTTPFELYVDGKFRKSYVPWFDGVLDSKYVNWRPLDGVNNLLFVDKTEDRAVAESGFHYYDIYLKKDLNGEYTLPNFVQVFCAADYPITNRTLYPDKDGNFIPPVTVRAGDVTNWVDGTAGDVVAVGRPDPNETYYIVQYDALDSPSGTISANPRWAHGDLSVKIGTVTKKYKVYYVNGAVMIHFALVDQDPASPDAKIVYKYTLPSADFQPVFSTTGSGSDAHENLQLETFNYPILHAFGWWTPECKPAIYLYPQSTTPVHVTVKPDGMLTYTDPLYPPDGWRVIASPDGTLTKDGKTYPYLYYESKIHDRAIIKPQKGYVVSFNELPTLFSKVLPKLGLNAKETAEFKTYWQGKLPEAPYYFVGAMEEAAVNAIEPMTIAPSPDSVIRVRLYFEALQTFKQVPEPQIRTPERKGFVVSEWGGLVKTDKNHPFTCSQ